jgi:3-carboxy-cis,cis-muconate cycloisomerase
MGLVAKKNEKAAGFVHWGATSQDAIDTGTILQIRGALDLIDQDTARLADSLTALAEKHSATLMAGRSWMQQAGPTTLGLKAAGWLDAMGRHRERLGEMRTRVLVLQFGGAVGTLAAFGDQGLAVAASLAEELKLSLPAMSWHSHRDRLAEVAGNLGMLVGTLGKIARDISLMAQTEVGEVSEPAVAGRGGSSTLPQKRNPVSSAAILAAAERVPALVSVMLGSMTQEHERGLGGWHAEWETLPEIFLLAAGAIAHTNFAANGLEVNEKRLAANLNLSGGLIMAESVAFALAKHTGKSRAHEIVQQACRLAMESGRPLAEILNEDEKVRAHLSPEEMARSLDPRNYLGSAREMIRSVLQAHQKDKS